MQFAAFYELILDLLQGIKTNELTSALIYVYDISTVMYPGATALKRSLFSVWLLLSSLPYGDS